MRKIKVLMIGPLTPPYGGIGVFVEGLLSSSLKEKVDLSHLNTSFGRPSELAGKLSLLNAWLAVQQYLEFVRLFERTRPDVVYVHTSQGWAFLKDSVYVVWARLLLSNVVVHVHAADFHQFYQSRSGLVKVYIKIVLSMTHRVVAVSESWRGLLGDVVDHDKVIAILNAIPLGSLAERCSHRGVSQNTSKEVRILFMGFIGVRKGTFDLIRALHLMHRENCPFRIVFVGKSHKTGDREKAIRMCEEFGLVEVSEFVDSVYGAKKTKCFKDADIFALPSYAEGLPIVILEAMAAGLPIVTTPVGGIPEVVEDGANGFLVRSGDFRLLAEKLSALVASEELRNEMRRNNIQKARKHFGLERWVDKMMEVIGEVARARVHWKGEQR